MSGWRKEEVEMDRRRLAWNSILLLTNTEERTAQNRRKKKSDGGLEFVLICCDLGKYSVAELHKHTDPSPTPAPQRQIHLFEILWQIWSPTATCLIMENRANRIPLVA